MTNDFNGFGLPPKLLQSLARMQFEQPTPIQAKAIPLALEGRDILGSAQTGTGKTGAFGIPLIAKLIENETATALVMTPTRELASQVIAMMQQLIPVQNIKTALLIGGEAMPKQLRQLQMHPRLIVGTPGRINDHLERGSVKLGNVRVLVLDETDRMLDMGFGVQIDRILQHMPQQRQTMLFSATLPSAIVKLSSKYLKNPERISVGSTIAAAPNIRQELIQTSDAEKGAQLQKVLSETKGSIIIFVKTKFGTEKLAERLRKQDYRADAIHGDLRQARRDKVIQNFRDKRFQILVATDVAARGLDVPHIETVINYDLPQAPEDFIHRIGRTARAGSSGVAISFITPSERHKWSAIHRLMNPGERLPGHDRDEGARTDRSKSKWSRSGRKDFQKPYQKSEKRFDRDGERKHDFKSDRAPQKRFDRDEKREFSKDGAWEGKKRFPKGEKRSDHDGERKHDFKSDRAPQKRFDRDEKSFGRKNYSDGDRPERPFGKFAGKGDRPNRGPSKSGGKPFKSGGHKGGKPGGRPTKGK